MAPDQIVADVRAWYERLGYCVVAVSEGLKDDKGNEIRRRVAATEVDAFGHARKGGVVEYLEALLGTPLALPSAMTSPDTCSAPSAR